MTEFCSYYGFHDPVFSADEVAAILAFKAKIKPEEGDVGTRNVGGGFSTHKQTRTSSIRWVHNDADTAWLFGRLHHLLVEINQRAFRFHLDRMEPLQLTEYSGQRGEHYGAHVDCGYGDSPIRFRKLSFTVQLSDGADYEGGDLKLYDHTFEPFVAPRVRGSLIAFRSYIMHEVTPVTAGIRDSLVGWVSGDEIR